MCRMFRLGAWTLGVSVALLAQLSVVELADQAGANIRQLTDGVFDQFRQKSEELLGPHCKPVRIDPISFIKSDYPGAPGKPPVAMYTIKATTLYVFENGTVPLSQHIHLTLSKPKGSNESGRARLEWFNNRVDRDTELQELGETSVQNCRSLKRLAYERAHSTSLEPNRRNTSSRKPHAGRENSAPKLADTLQGYLNLVAIQLKRKFPCKFLRLKLVGPQYGLSGDGKSFLVKAKVVRGKQMPTFVHLYIHKQAREGELDRTTLGLWDNSVEHDTELKPFTKIKRVGCQSERSRFRSMAKCSLNDQDDQDSDASLIDRLMASGYPCEIKSIEVQGFHSLKISNPIGSYIVKKILVETREFGCHLAHYYKNLDESPPFEDAFDNTVDAFAAMVPLDKTVAVKCDQVKQRPCASVDLEQADGWRWRSLSLD